MSSTELIGDRVELRLIGAEDLARLRAIREAPTVRRWWGDNDLSWPLAEDDTEDRAIWYDGGLVGFVQWYEHADPLYRHAGIDLFLDGPAQGFGLGRETVSLVIGHLVDNLGHHRVVIDPAAANARAIACYAACGFRVVGRMRRYERDVDGSGWHDGLLMELVVDP